MLTSEYSRRPLKLTVKQWRLTSSTCLVLVSRIIFLNGVKTTFKTIQIAILGYPCIICSSIQHRLGDCPKKIKVWNMFRTKHVSYNATIALKAPKIDNVPINVVAIVTTRIQQSEHKVFKEREPVKTKGVEEWQ
jgi:hypothetical protein